MATQESAGQLLRHGEEVATAESLQRERDMIEAVNRDQGSFDPLGRGRKFIAADTFAPSRRRQSSSSWTAGIAPLRSAARQALARPPHSRNFGADWPKAAATSSRLLRP